MTAWDDKNYFDGSERITAERCIEEIITALNRPLSVSDIQFRADGTSVVMQSDMGAFETLNEIVMIVKRYKD